MRTGLLLRLCAIALAAGVALPSLDPTAADEPAPGQLAPLPQPVLQYPVEPAVALQAAEANLQPAPQPAANTPDAGTVSVGQAAFARSCTSCHDEQRSLQRTKSYAGWLATVRRMASKEGADISSADVVPIATYLASVAGPSGGGAASEGNDEGGGWSFATTVSTLHRSASDAYPLENPGFFADVWVTAAYQSSGPLRGTVTACTSCHSRDNGGAGNAYSIELVEGSASLDLRHLFHGCRCDDGHELLLKAGRFVVPFGAFASMSHPGSYRTVTNPLIFNMGRRVLTPNFPPGQPVLPQPFSDEGIDLIYRAQVGESLMFSCDLYAVNGLQGTGNNIFNRSRAYFDNNEEPSGGIRLALGGDYFRLGVSALGGNLQDQNLPQVDYALAGADATVQITDRLRFYFEYAIRDQDSTFVAGQKEKTFGTVTQLEFRVWDAPYIGLLISYDTLDHRHPIFGENSLSRFTSGFNIGLPGGSLLMINHERWSDHNGDEVDVFGVRWSITL